MDKVIVLVGPTGVGKTKWSIALAKALNGEIISGDAYQIYKELSIGSAKIKEEEKQGIPHYLVDCINYDASYNVKMFQEQARMHMQEIINKGKVPIICGGTGLYVKALLYDYVFEEEEVDVTYQQELDSQSNEGLYALLQGIDAKACEKIHPNNRQRIVRALMMAHQGLSKSERDAQQEHKVLYDAYIIGLTMEREALYERINARVLQMVEEGLEQEVTTLHKQKKDLFTLQSMQGIGYKEWEPYFNQEATLEETIALIQKNSRNFAKRQYTWFNNQMDVHWFDVRKEEETKRMLETAIQFCEEETK